MARFGPENGTAGRLNELAGEAKAISCSLQRASKEGIHVRFDGHTFGVRLHSECAGQKGGAHDEVVHSRERIADGVREGIVKKISLLVTFQRAKWHDDNSGGCSGS